MHKAKKGFNVYMVHSHKKVTSRFHRGISQKRRKMLIKLAAGKTCHQIDYLKTVSYTIRLDQDTFDRVEGEARRKKKKLADIFRETITYGLPALPPLPKMEGIIADTWEKLGPAPEID